MNNKNLDIEKELENLKNDVPESIKTFHAIEQLKIELEILKKKDENYDLNQRSDDLCYFVEQYINNCFAQFTDDGVFVEFEFSPYDETYMRMKVGSSSLGEIDKIKEFLGCKKLKKIGDTEKGDEWYEVIFSEE